MPSLRYRYQTIEFGDIDIHLRTLKDRQQYADPDGIASALGISPATWPLFGVVWASSEVLAQLMQDYEVDGLRILEVGCGIGLASLMLNQRDADITATDHHPSAGSFLQHNSDLNDGRDIPFVRTDWDDAASELGEFDLIIGSDLLYEPDHAAQLAGFIDQHAKERCEVIIIDPNRGNSGRFSRHMTELGYAHSRSVAETPDCQDEPYRGKILRYTRAATAPG